jgi:hypothetical protein
VLLLQWEELTRRQAKYDEELRTLHATGDQLSAEWDSLAAARQRCLDDLGTLGTPPHEVIERAWTLFKAQLWMHCQIAKRERFSNKDIPTAITTLAEPLTRNPRIL